MIPICRAAPIALLTVAWSLPLHAQRHKEKDVAVIETELQTLLVFPDPASGLYVWAEWKDPTIGEAHVGRFDPADVDAFVVSARELLSRNRPSPDGSARYEHSEPIEDIDQGMLQIARYRQGEFWRDYISVQLLRAPGAIPMDVDLRREDAEDVLVKMQEIARKTDWDPEYRQGLPHSNPAVRGSTPAEDPDNEPVIYPTVLYDQRVNSSGRSFEGDTFLSFVVDETGKVDKKSMRVWMSDHRTLTREVTGKAEDWMFRPVKREGRAISVHVFYRIPFRVDNRNP